MEVRHDPKLHGDTAVSRFSRDLINRSGSLRRVVKSGPVQAIVYTLRVAAEVRKPLAFVWAQMFGPELTLVETRRTGINVYLRRRSGDLVMFHQIIGRDSYEPTPEVASALERDGGVSRIADLGSNIGLFTVSVLGRYPTAQVIALEADPANAAIFEKTIAANSWEGQVDLRAVAAMAEAGRIELAGGDFYRSHVIDADENSTTSVEAVDALPLMAGCDLVKIDIEGSEWPILADPRFGGLEARAMAMEWHRFGCPAPDPKAAADRYLTDAGFTLEHDFVDEDCGTFWAWKAT